MTYTIATKALTKWHFWQEITYTGLELLPISLTTSNAVPFVLDTRYPQPMLPRDIPDEPWKELATDYFTHYSKDYLLIAGPVSKIPLYFQSSFQDLRQPNPLLARPPFKI